MRTFGVEEELLLVDIHSGRLVAAAQPLMARQRPQVGATADNDGGESGRGEGDGLTLEVQQEQIEVISPPCSTLTGLLEAIRRGRSRADAAAQLVGARAVAMATSIEPVSAHLVPKPRYLDMMARFGLLLKEQLTCGFHVHVSVESEEEGVAVLDRIRVWLPVILALSCNSPFWHGTDTSYGSYRYQVWGRWPSAGPSEIFGSAAAYRLLISAMLDSGVLLDQGMVYFDARLSPHQPTVEIRIADVCMRAEHAAALAGVIRALVETAAQAWRAGEPPLPVKAIQLRLASWQASKYGVEGELLHPLLNKPCASAVAVEALLEHARPVLAQCGEQVQVEQVLARILGHGTGSRRQRLAMSRTGSRLSVVSDAIDITHA
ncbi:MAG: glutamate--cysteine ligase [Actinomycetota bacterium]|nr:glutamate--cysteine ligase [Actinomycetota bacterium]